jgi:hypothetical protein
LSVSHYKALELLTISIILVKRGFTLTEDEAV